MDRQFAAFRALGGEPGHQLVDEVHLQPVVSWINRRFQIDDVLLGLMRSEIGSYGDSDVNPLNATPSLIRTKRAERAMPSCGHKRLLKFVRVTCTSNGLPRGGGTYQALCCDQKLNRRPAGGSSGPRFWKDRREFLPTIWFQNSLRVPPLKGKLQPSTRT